MTTFYQTLQKLLVLAILLGLGTTSLWSQITMGSGNEPQSFSILQLDGNSGGLRLNQLTTAQRDALTVAGNDLSRGLTIFNVTTNQIEMFDGNSWIQLMDGNSVSWNSVATGRAATSNLEDIYQIGSIGIGTQTPDANALLDVTSTTKGVLFPRMTNDERNRLDANVANGLFIYNTTTNCFNYFESRAAKWVSLCGNYDPAQLTITGCGDPAVGPSTNDPLRQSVSLSADLNTYTILVNVVQAGTYRIVVKTDNNYSYEASGTFLNPSINERIVLKGQGQPRNANPTVGDAVSVEFNGVDIPLPAGCVLPNVTVLSSQTTVTANGNITVTGDYYVATDLDGNIQYVDVPITVVTGGPASISTLPVDGFSFASGPIEIDNTTTSIRLYPQGGRPVVGGSFTYTFRLPGSATESSFVVRVQTRLGTFQFPAKSCLAILNEDPTKTDGEYFIRRSATSNAPLKTLCDMTNGGYTLVHSYSEYSIYGRSQQTGADYNAVVPNNQSLATNAPRNIPGTSAVGDVIPYQSYRLPTATMQSVRNGASRNVFRMRIVQDRANLANNNDAWAKDNYLVFDFSTSENNEDFLTGTFAAKNDVRVDGKIFTKTFYKESATGTPYGNFSFDGTTWRDVNAAGVWNNNNAAVVSIQPYSAVPNVSFTYTNPDASTTTSNINQLNDLGNVYNGEAQINHHIGKCGASTAPDYGNATISCNSFAGARSPHSFNPRGDGSFEGRYVQWFVK